MSFRWKKKQNDNANVKSDDEGKKEELIGLEEKIHTYKNVGVWK